MKKIKAITPLLLLTLFASTTTFGQESNSKILLSKDIVRGVYGVGGVINMSVKISNDTIREVKIISHGETPEYFESVVNERLIERWNGKSLKEASKMEVDAVSGSTVSSEAIIKSMKQIINFAK